MSPQNKKSDHYCYIMAAYLIRCYAPNVLKEFKAHTQCPQVLALAVVLTNFG